MNKRTVNLVILGLFFLLGACKSEFEKLRISNNPEKQLEAAYKYFEEEEYLKAKTLLETVISNYLGRPESEKIYHHYAYCSYYLNQFISAQYYFKRFSSTFPNSDLREEAEFMAAYSYYRLSPSFRLDQTYTLKAIDEFQLFINTFPTNKRVKEANDLINELRRKLEKKAFYEAELYYKLENYQSATIAFENLLKDYPETPNAEEIRYLVARGAYLLAENSVLLKQEERYLEAVKKSELFLNKFKGSRYSNEISKIKEDSNKKLKEIRNE